MLQSLLRVRWTNRNTFCPLQVTLALRAMGAEAIIMSAGELEAGNAGEPAKLLRQRYREAGDFINKARASLHQELGRFWPLCCPVAVWCNKRWLDTCLPLRNKLSVTILYLHYIVEQYSPDHRTRCPLHLRSALTIM